MSNPKVSFWKPRPSNDGAVAHFDYSEKNRCFFLQMMAQNPPEADAKFDKTRSLNVKLGLNDVGDMLAVINGRKDGCGNMKNGGWSGLYHKNQQGNAIINFGFNQGVCNLKVSVQKGGGSPNKLDINLTLGEIEVLAAFLKAHMHNMFVPEEYNPENSGE